MVVVSELQFADARRRAYGTGRNVVGVLHTHTAGGSHYQWAVGSGTTTAFSTSYTTSTLRIISYISFSGISCARWLCADQAIKASVTTFKYNTHTIQKLHFSNLCISYWK